MKCLSFPIRINSMKKQTSYAEFLVPLLFFAPLSLQERGKGE
jgi:hypothetical protein